MLVIPQLLSKHDVARVRSIVDAGEWIDGADTAGPQSALAKRNTQLVEASTAAREAGSIVLAALERSPLFIAGALPLKVFPPLFNRYAGGDAFGRHVDNAVRILRGRDFRIRSDLSATLFLSEPEDYDGGELVVETAFGDQSIKCAAGDLVVYPATTLHAVTPVTRGERICCFFWLQSMVRDDGERRLLLQLDTAVQTLVADKGNADATVIALTGLYHNLLRRWADA